MKQDHPSNTFKITLELLLHLDEEGYQALLMNYGEDAYVPMKVSMDELVGDINMVALREDYPIPIIEAIERFEELRLAEETLIISNGNT